MLALSSSRWNGAPRESRNALRNCGTGVPGSPSTCDGADGGTVAGHDGNGEHGVGSTALRFDARGDPRVKITGFFQIVEHQPFDIGSARRWRRRAVALRNQAAQPIRIETGGAGAGERDRPGSFAAGPVRRSAPPTRRPPPRAPEHLRTRQD